MTTKSKIEIVKKAGRIGAEVRGVKLTPDIDEETLTQIKEALSEHLVLFFRGQDHLDNDTHEEFSKRFGELYAHPTVPVKENTKAILELDSQYGAKANSWHTDVSFVPDVPRYSILRGVEIPSYGGDTIWANTHTAYTDLPKELQELTEKLWAIHSNKFDYAAYAYLNESREKAREYAEKHQSVFARIEYETRHPVVFVHPENGKKHLLLGHFIRQFEGFSTSQSAALYELLQSYVTRPENTVRWNWQKGDLIIWDNLASQHYAVADYDERRIVRRVTVSKNIPKNVNGEESSLIKKK